MIAKQSDSKIVTVHLKGANMNVHYCDTVALSDSWRTVINKVCLADTTP